MQLILAIDTDRGQASQLAALVRARLTVDLVQATSAGEALQVLGNRIPDLILTPALLSPFDDGVLAEYLRDLGPAGAHVQTLRIPVLGAAQARPSRWSSLFRRRRPAAPSAHGCDPGVFADEIGVYLARAEEARHATEALVGGREPDTADRIRLDAAAAAWDGAERRPATPVHAGADVEWSEPPAWSAPAPAAWEQPAAAEPAAAVWQEPGASAWEEPAAAWADSISNPAVGEGERDPVASEWEIPARREAPAHGGDDERPAPAPVRAEAAEPVESDEPIRPLEAPAPIAASRATGAAASAPGPATGSPSFEAALAAIRAAWESPNPHAGARER